MRRRLLYSASNNGKPISNANYADICYYDSDTEQFVIVDVADIDKYTDARYTPIGIVAVPSSHTDEGRPRVMSLVYMNCDTPESGSVEGQDIDWGENIKISEMTDEVMIPYIAEVASSVTIDGIVKFENGSEKGFCLPSDSNGENGLNKFGYKNPSNYNEHFYRGEDSDYYFMCSPYKQDGSKDTRYFDTYGVLAYLDGNSNTKKIVTHRGEKDYSSWKPTYDNPSDYPAASCCDMFHTVGTSQGDWYLPSASELGYAIARMQAIQNSMQALINKGYTVGLLSTDSWYWSSTQYNYYYGYSVSFKEAKIGGMGNKVNGRYIRAFFAL